MIARHRVAAAVAICATTLAISAATMAATLTAASAATQPAQPSAAYARSLPQVRPGDSGLWTLALQLDLMGKQPVHLTGTGYYGTKTLRAVKSFQRHHGIAATGIVGPRTWTALIGGISVHVTMPHSTHYTPSYAMYPGDTDASHAAQLQRVLQDNLAYAEYARETTLSLPDSSYTAGWVQAVEHLQTLVGIRPSGVVGKKTWTALYELNSATGSWTPDEECD